MPGPRPKALWLPFLLGFLIPVPARAGESATVPGYDPILWSHDLGHPIAGRPAATSTAVAAVTENGQVVVLEPGNGQVRWRTELGEPVRVGPLIHGSRLLVAASGGKLYSWDLATGRPLWGRRLTGPLEAPLGLALQTDLLLIATPGEVLFLSADSGNLRQRRSFPGSPATPAVPCGGGVLLGTRDGRILGLPGLANGPTWEITCSDREPSTPTCTGRVAFVGCGNSLFRIGVGKGKIHWKFRTGGTITSRPVVTARRIFVGSFDNDIYVLKRDNGHLVRTQPSTHRVISDPLLLEGELLLLPHTSPALQVHPLPDLVPVRTLPLPPRLHGGCTAPVAMGTKAVVLGCGSEETRVLGIRLTPPGGERAAPPWEDPAEGKAPQGGLPEWQVLRLSP